MARGIIERSIEYTAGSASTTLKILAINRIERVEAVTDFSDDHHGHTRIFLHKGPCKYARESKEEIERAITEASA